MSEKADFVISPGTRINLLGKLSDHLDGQSPVFTFAPSTGGPPLVTVLNEFSNEPLNLYASRDGLNFYLFGFINGVEFVPIAVQTAVSFYLSPGMLYQFQIDNPDDGPLTVGC